MSDVAHAGIASIAQAFRHNTLTPTELVEHYLAGIAEYEGDLNAFLTVMSEEARAGARACEERVAREGWTSLLQGVPIGVKDVFDTIGVRTTAGSKSRLDFTPKEDAFCIARLREAGAIVLGKLATSEFAFGSTQIDGVSLPARNPWNPTFSPGFSSSGSGAAVVSGLCAAALGSDTAGSIRGPAGFCGIAGLRPTYGRVSRRGIFPLSYSLDTAGPMGRTVEDCALLLQAMAGFDEKDSASADIAVPDYGSALRVNLQGTRIGVARDIYREGSGVDADAAAAIDAAVDTLRDLGASVSDIELPDITLCHAVVRVILLAEAFSIHRDGLESCPSNYSPVLRDRLRLGAALTADDYIRSQRLRRRLADSMRSAMGGCDVVVMPMQYGRPPAFDTHDPYAFFANPNLAGPFSMTGQPALSVCCGYGADGMPFAMQIGGRPFEEETVLAVGHAYETATPWRSRRPPLAWHDRATGIRSRNP